MKMSDMFRLPVFSHKNHEGYLFDNYCEVVTCFDSDDGVMKDQCDAAAIAINCHDGLVELAEMVAGIDTASPQALKYMAVALAEKARYELAKTKGE